MLTVYALANRKDHITWQDVKYIGLSENIHARFAQHLACSDSCQPEKNEWMRESLAQGLMPMLLALEENIEEAKQGRAREQYWIRYAISQGAKLFNKQITYTEEERLQVHQRRAILYAKIAKLESEGHFVKRSVYWHPSSQQPKLDRALLESRVHAWQFHQILFELKNGDVEFVVDASDADFDAFVKDHLSVIDGGHIEWTWEDRLEVVNYLIFTGKKDRLFQDPDRKFPKAKKAAKKVRRKQK